MRRHILFPALVLAAGTSLTPAHSNDLQTRDPKGAMRLTSSAFAEHQEIPAAYTCEGKDISPPLQWSALPAGTKSLAVIVDDPDAPDPSAPRKTWVHWVVYNLPPDSAGLSEGVKEFPAGARQGRNDWQKPRYNGP